MKLIRLSLIVGFVLAAAIAVPIASAGMATSGISPRQVGPLPRYHSRPAASCDYGGGMCTEVDSRLSYRVFGHYVGHDEPSVLFNSDVPGSGNHMSYNMVLPKDPSASNPTSAGKSYQFELSGADWFGMAMCDTQSYPEQVRFCPPDSNRNILDPSVSARHVGQAYMEMQFYPPGWIPWPTWQKAVGASSCSPTRWCAALNIDSLSFNPVTNQMNNKDCQREVGEEYFNFAFITKNGKSTGPANPVDATTAGTYTPSPSKDLFMNSGDHLKLQFTDTNQGLRVTIRDITTGKTGTMTASKANGFAQIKFAPKAKTCTAIPYNFHPMYGTSTAKTRVTWAASGYNVAMDTEIGHFQFCTGPKKIPATRFGVKANGQVTTCPSGNKEGQSPNKQPSDPPSKANPAGDDAFCFPASEALTYKVAGCTFTNIGFDGASYQKLWPDGNTKMHPTALLFSSPKTGKHYNTQYRTAALDTDLPDVEFFTCNTNTGRGCTHIPTTDHGTPAAFYPFYSTTSTAQGCMWRFGNNQPHQISNYGGERQYGHLLGLTYTTKATPDNRHGGSVLHYNVFQAYLNGNPCPQK